MSPGSTTIESRLEMEDSGRSIRIRYVEQDTVSVEEKHDIRGNCSVKVINSQ